MQSAASRYTRIPTRLLLIVLLWSIPVVQPWVYGLWHMFMNTVILRLCTAYDMEGYALTIVIHFNSSL